MGGNYFDARSFDTEINTKKTGAKNKVSNKAPRVLVVDDSILVRKQISNILSSEGYDIVGTSSDGFEGVEQYKKLYPHIDLVTMDLIMPGMDGVTALEHILEFDKEARVLMVSALGKEEYVNKAMEAGARDYIVKPLDKEKVMERVVRVLR